MKYLVIQTRDIGDVMLSTALCNTLKENYPAAEVDMLTMDYCAGVVRGNPNISEIIEIKKSERNKLGYILKTLCYIRAKKYDAIVNMQGQVVGLLCCLFSLSSRRIGLNKFPWRYAHSDQVPFPFPDQPSGDGHTMDLRFSLLAPLSVKVSSRDYRLWLSDSESAAAQENLTGSGLDLSRPIVALGINSRDDYKQWPIDYFARIASWLIEAFGVQILVFFGPGEESYSKQLKPLVDESIQAHVFDNLRTTSIRELAAVFSHCSLYVGNDTGPRHIAQALNVPAFAIVSPASNKWTWVPWHNPRFKAIDTGDALGLNESEWLAISSKLSKGVDDAPWFARLSPEFAQAQLQAMINDLKLFNKD
ncbi:MAG: heptosyltransferase-3 [Planctomycetota bacterium]|jgi:heptosyltransferase-3